MIILNANTTQVITEQSTSVITGEKSLPGSTLQFPLTGSEDLVLEVTTPSVYTEVKDSGKVSLDGNKANRQLSSSPLCERGRNLISIRQTIPVRM